MATPVGEPHYFFRRGVPRSRRGRSPRPAHPRPRAPIAIPCSIQAWSPTMPNVCAFNSLGPRGGRASTRRRPIVSQTCGSRRTPRDSRPAAFAAQSRRTTTPIRSSARCCCSLPAPQPGHRRASTLTGIADAPRPRRHRRLRAPRHGGAPHRRSTAGSATRARSRCGSRRCPSTSGSPDPTDPVKSLDELAEYVARSPRGGRSRRRLGARRGHHGLGDRHCAAGQHEMAEAVPRRVRSRDDRPVVRQRGRGRPRGCASAPSTGLQLNFCAMGPSEHDLFLDAVERHGVRGGVVQHGAIMPIEHARRWAAAGFRQTVCCGFTWGKGDVYRRAFGEEVLARPQPVATPARRRSHSCGRDRLGTEEPVGADVARRDPPARSLGCPQRRRRSGDHPRGGVARCGPRAAPRCSIGPSSVG